MSFNLEQVRKYYQDPMISKIAEFTKRLAKLETDNIEIETDDFVGTGDSDHTKIRYNDRWNFIKNFTLPATNPQLCYEPDYDKFVLDLRFGNMGNELSDFSGFDNKVEIFGEPCPASGVAVPYRGGSMKNTGWEIRQAEQVYCRIGLEDQFENPITYFDMEGETIGQSWIFRLNFNSLNSSLGSQTLIEKYDSNNDNYSIRVSSDGNIHYIVTRAGTPYKKKTNNVPITINSDLEIAITYNVSGNVTKFYVNGTEDTSTATSSEVFNTFNFNEPYLFANVPATTDTPVAGFVDLNYIDMMRLYHNRVLTGAEILNHYENKISISDIDAGNVLVFDGCVFGPNPILQGYTSTGYTSIGYTT